MLSQFPLTVVFKQLLVALFVLLNIKPVLSQNFVNYTDENGLPNNHIHDLLQDQTGFIWIATEEGLVRFDGTTFRTFQHSIADSTSISSNRVERIHQTPAESLVVTTFGNGFNFFDPTTEVFTRYTQHPTKNLSTEFFSYQPFTGYDGQLWITTPGLMQWDEQRQSVIHHPLLRPENTSSVKDPINVIRSITADPQNADILWLAGREGLFRFDSCTKTFELFRHQPPQAESHAPTSILAISTDVENLDLLWLGSWGQGLLCFDMQTKKFRRFLYDNTYPSDESKNIIHDLLPKNDKELWVACRKGLGIFNKETATFTFFEHDPALPKSILPGAATCLLKDRQGTLWIGMKSGISQLDQRNNLFRQIPLADEQYPRLSVNGTLLNNKGELMIGTYAGPGLIFLDLETGKTRAKNFPELASTRAENIEITDLFRTKDHSIFAITRVNTYRFDPEQESFQLLFPPPFKIHHNLSHTIAGNGDIWVSQQKSSLKKIAINTGEIIRFGAGSDLEKHLPDVSYICDMTTDTNGNIWVVNKSGVSKFDATTHRITHYLYDARSKGGFSTPVVLGIEQDNAGMIWVATESGGIHRFDPTLGANQDMQHFTTDDGLLSNSGYNMKKDCAGNIWCGTRAGLVRINPETFEIKVFYKKDGMSDQRFIHQAISLHTDCSLSIYGNYSTRKELLLWHPDSLKFNETPPDMVFTKLLVQDTLHPLSQRLKNNAQLELTFQENFFTIYFAALNFSQPQANTYEYELEGFNNGLVKNGAQNFASFTNVPPGDYVFRVKATNNDGIKNQEGIALNIKIWPPWYQSKAAYFLYALAALLLLYAIFKILLRRQELYQKIATEQQRAAHLTAMDEFKTRFYTGITHEFRSPLTVILGMVDQIRKKPDDLLFTGLELIKSNSKNLLSLINQMLDLSRLQDHAMPVVYENVEIVLFVKQIIESYHWKSSTRRIVIEFQSNVTQARLGCDIEKLRQILVNLLDNALKFTTENGRITCHLSVEEAYFSLTISDNGIGIPAKKLPYIFEQFYQVNHQQGSGVGLTLTKELITLLNGRIEVKSTEGQGSSFIVQLPVIQPEQEESAILRQQTTSMENSSIDAHNKNNLPILLIIEDNKDVLFYIQTCVHGNYLIHSATDGEVGIAKALKYIPDIIISDVMMDKTDGFAVCKKLKTDERTSHIPIILLTAKASKADKLSGLKSGADAYLTKPFDQQELLIRLQKLIEIRKQIKKRFQVHSLIEGKNHLTNQEEVFILKVNQVLEKNLDNLNLSASNFAEQLFLSRMQLHRKLIALTGLSTSNYIRQYRIHKAHHILKTSSKSITEVSLEVGFKDLSYFSRSFSEEFGMPPNNV